MITIYDSYNRSNGMNFTVSEYPEPNTDQWSIHNVYSVYDKAIITNIDTSTFNVVPADTSTFVDVINIEMQNAQTLTKGARMVTVPFELHAVYEDYEFFQIRNDGSGTTSGVTLHPDSSYNMYYYCCDRDIDPLMSEFHQVTSDTSIIIQPHYALYLYADASAYRNKQPISFTNATGLVFWGDIKFMLQGIEITQDYAFEGFFKNCTTFPSLPAIPDSSIITVGCYKEMYMNSGVRTIPTTQLSAEFVPSCAYQSMFENCTSLANTSSTTAVNRMRNFMKKATSCGDYSFARMYKGCTSLVSGAIPNVTSWGENPFQSMFEGCSNLTNITCYFVNTRENIMALFQSSDWAKNTSTSSAQFTLSRELLTTTYSYLSEENAKIRARSDFGLPSNWTVAFLNLT